MSDGTYDVKRTEEQWRRLLSPEEFRVLRQAGTEAPFTGEYTDTKTEGCTRAGPAGAELFRSETKFDSHCGWPSFYGPLAQDRVEYVEDRSLGRVRTEVRCASCGSHLGHVFEGEGLRHAHRPEVVLHQLGLPHPGADGVGQPAAVVT